MEIVDKNCCNKYLTWSQLIPGRTYRLVEGSLSGNNGEIILAGRDSITFERRNIRLRDGTVYHKGLTSRYVEVKAKVCVED